MNRLHFACRVTARGGRAEWRPPVLQPPRGLHACGLRTHHQPMPTCACAKRVQSQWVGPWPVRFPNRNPTHVYRLRPLDRGAGTRLSRNPFVAAQDARKGQSTILHIVSGQICPSFDTSRATRVHWGAAWLQAWSAARRGGMVCCTVVETGTVKVCSAPPRMTRGAQPSMSCRRSRMPPPTRIS